MAIAEAISNIALRRCGAKSATSSFSANWMVAAGHGHEDANLFATVEAVAQEFCPALGVCIPVGQGFDVDADGLAECRRRRAKHDRDRYRW